MTNIFITGVNRGIGLALARLALEKGFAVYGSVRSQQDADSLRAELGGKFHPLVFDITDHEAMAEAVFALDEPIDILINNAGIMGPSPDEQRALATDFAGFLNTLAVNALGPLRVSQLLLPVLRKSDRPRILAISSGMASIAATQSDHIAYRASKLALNKIMQCLATDLAGEEIVVLLVDPGWVQTDMGGASASLTPEISAAGILDLAEKAAMPMSGKFYHWNGSPRSF